jgi:hypothetical protein
MAQQWLKNKEATSASVHIPEEMVKSALKVKASTSVPQSIKTKSKWRCKLKIGILYLFFIKNPICNTFCFQNSEFPCIAYLVNLSFILVFLSLIPKPN